MEILLLGTAAAEGWPCPWCACAACTEARRRGGRDLRTRSSALLDGVVKVDFNADTLMQMMRAGRDLTRLSTLIFTHAHNDHCTPVELQYRGPWFVTGSPPAPLHVYGSAQVLCAVRAALDNPDALGLELHPPLEPFQTVGTPDGTEILALPAAHVPGTLLLRLTRDGRRVFYGHDSGIYPDETVAALGGTPLDMALFDCTYGPQPNEYKGHLGIEGVLNMIERLRTVGAITPRTKLVATHFSHNGGLGHEELVSRFAPRGVEVAYDGMILDV